MDDAAMNQSLITESSLSGIDPLEVMNKISRFRKLNIATMSDKQLQQEILDTLLDDNTFNYITNTKLLPKGTYFFRVRKLKSSVISEMNINTVQDLWEPPQIRVVKPGRLNKIGESLLYTSPGDPLTAVKEMRLNAGNWYALIRYTAKRDVKINIIGGEYDYVKLGYTNKKAIMVHELYNSFLRDEFSRDVVEGTEYFYRISERIAKDYFDLPREIQDAWCYASVIDKQRYNTCFRPTAAHEVLHLDGAMICKKGFDDIIKVYCVAIPSDDLNRVVFYPLGSAIQKHVFPEIVQS